ncbi:probable C-mannosyltransferase DPY19L3 [Asterias rubens]|uniref:probable C-mannosyltransferase DPY19L3 n=1 Tax=Asterias rubens TaxID=7604 RepID=UPI0014557D59|nr:probable C-mannosyltransferase DPY19L3 [Asterias rubens]
MGRSTGKKRNANSTNGFQKQCNNNNYSNHNSHLNGKSNGFEPARNGRPHFQSRSAKQNSQQSFAWMKYASWAFGATLAVYLGYMNAWYFNTLHENRLWFSNIKEVEREISFRTEAGFYYSYFKQMVFAPSISEGLYALTHDNDTENWRTINTLERFNIYQEVILSIVYKALSLVQNVQAPIFFYVNTVFNLHGLYLISLYCTAWLLSGSWLAGVLASAFYILNREDTTRVDFTIPLRESFAIPFIHIQMALITYYLRPTLTIAKQRVSLVLITLSSFLFVLTWQFSQFVLLLQAIALYGSSCLGMVPTNKVNRLLLIQGVSILSVCALQFFNKMLLGSLAFSFILAALLDLRLQERRPSPAGMCTRVAKLLCHIVTCLTLMVIINVSIKFTIGVDADEHIFKFLKAKFGIDNTMDFDARLYSCNGAFVFLPMDTIWRLTRRLVFPLYVVTLTGLLMTLAVAVYQNWRKQAEIAKGKKDDEAPIIDTDSSHVLSDRPELAYLTIQTVLSAGLAATILRLKYLWTPHMCVLAAFGICDYRIWRALLQRLRISSETAIQGIRHTATLIVLAALLYITLDKVYADLEELREFYDPDTVELMNWIRQQTPKATVFSGSMQLLAGVKLCTGRRLTNHPHYEDKELRERTLQLYQYYGQRTPKDVYDIHKATGTDYIILEDSICYARASQQGCRLPDLIDMTNGHMYSGAKADELHLLKKAEVGRFCDVIQRQQPEYTRYFVLVFQNKTFRVYQVL